MSPDEVREMASAIDGVSLSLLLQIRRKKYKSVMTYPRMRKCIGYLEKVEARKAKAAA